jgi:hypothetical protein
MVNSTWNPSDKSVGITLSGGDLTAKETATTFLNNNVRAAHSQLTGKYYWEYTCTTFTHANAAIGFTSNATDLNSTLLSGTTNTCVLSKAGAIWVNGANIGGIAFGTVANGTVVGIAIDLTAKLVWFRLGASGQWNMSGTANPATGTGGVSVSAITVAVFPVISVRTLNDQIIANFGDTAFTGAVPSGFTSGFPTLPPGPAGRAKVWTGSAWVTKPAKVWSGSAWVTKPAKVWNGSAWV